MDWDEVYHTYYHRPAKVWGGTVRTRWQKVWDWLHRWTVRGR